MNYKLKLIICLLVSIAVLVPLYILLHESGHTIVMLSAGAAIDDFSLFGAHVSSHGGVYTTASELWLHANGAVFPAVITSVYILFYRRSFESIFYRVFSFLLGIITYFSLLAWVIVPIIYMNGSAPQNDDVTQFLNVLTQSSTVSPPVISLAALTLSAAGFLLMIKKGVLQNYIKTLKMNEKTVS